MKVLIVCSGNYGCISPYILEQADSLIKLGINIDFFLIKGKGWLGYLLNYTAMKKKINSFLPSLIHAHYGLSGMLAVLQNKVPVIVTFHGSDINTKGYERFISKLAFKYSRHSIYVSKKLVKKANVKSKFSIIPCGVEMSNAVDLDRRESRRILGLDPRKKYILFSSSFDNPIKNYKLAQQAVSSLGNIFLLELKGYSRNEVALLMNASDCVLLTSYSEGSPQVIKEAMSCNCPIVTTDVGDVKWVIGNSDGCFITSFEPEDVAEKINRALDFGQKTKGRNRIIELGLDSDTVANKLIELYHKTLNLEY